MAAISEFHAPIAYESKHPVMLLDSGAFTLFKSGGVVDFDRYTAYVGTVKNEVLAAINLDIIPGKWRKRATPAETERACIASFERWRRLQATGALIVPVFHQTDDPSWLARYLDHGATYIGISPSDNMADALRKRWLLQTHDELARSGVGLNRTVFTHVLGLLSPKALNSLKGAAWSADASTTMQHSVRYRLMLPFNDDAIAPSGNFDTIKVAFVGERTDVADDTPISAEEVAAYLSEVGYGDDYKIAGDRVVIDNIHALASVNFKLAHRLNRISGVRCFIAGPDERVLRQIIAVERYPYLLRTYAGVTETSGAMVRKYYDRALRPY